MLITAFIICLGGASCKKDSKSSNPIVGNWKMTAYIHDSIDVYGTAVSPCITDNILTFTDDQKLTNDEGPTKCDPADPQTVSGTYSLNSEKTQLTVTHDGISDVYGIKTLNSTTLEVTQPEDDITYTKLL